MIVIYMVNEMHVLSTFHPSVLNTLSLRSPKKFTRETKECIFFFFFFYKAQVQKVLLSYISLLRIHLVSWSQPSKKESWKFLCTQDEENTWRIFSTLWKCNKCRKCPDSGGCQNTLGRSIDEDSESKNLCPNIFCITFPLETSYWF